MTTPRRVLATVEHDGEHMFSVLPDGTVEYGKAYTPERAAKAVNSVMDDIPRHGPLSAGASEVEILLHVSSPPSTDPLDVTGRNTW